MFLEMLMNPSFQSRYVSSHYSCTYNTNSQIISETVGDGHYRVHIYAFTFRQFLCLPQMAAYEAPTGNKFRSVLPQLGYDSSCQGSKSDHAKVVLYQRFPVGWKYVTGVIGNCLGHKIGSIDQLNLFELHILYSMV